MLSSKHIHPLPDHREASVVTYLTGACFSLVLTASAFALVWAYKASDGLFFSKAVLLGFLTFLAIGQIFVQVLYFLHMSTQRAMRLNVYAGAFTIFVVLCLVIGSIWIMQNLDYNMMPGHTSEHMQTEENIHHH